MKHLMLLVLLLAGCARHTVVPPLYLAATCSPGYLKGYLEGALASLGYVAQEPGVEAAYIGSRRNPSHGLIDNLTVVLAETPKGFLVKITPSSYREEQLQIELVAPSNKVRKDAVWLRKAMAKLPCVAE